MKKRSLGVLEVSSLGLGCMGMSEYYGRTDQDEAIKTIRKAIAMGVTFLDTADMYGLGRNEELVGRAVRRLRDQVVISTKFGYERNFNGQFIRINGTPDYVKAACDASLRRLQVEVIDLYLLHRPDPKVPIEDTVGAMGELVSRGKVRAIGLSEVSAKKVRCAYKTYPITALQTEYSLWSRDVEAEILPVCRELNIGFIAYSPLGRGFLTGKVEDLDQLASDDFRRSLPRFQDGNLQKNRVLVDRIEELAKEKGCSAPQLVLAWLLAQGDDIVPIPGTKSRKHLKEDLKACTIKLSREELEQIEKAVPQASVSGMRYSEGSMKKLDS